VVDCETDNLLDKMTKLHCLQMGEAETDESVIYADHPGFPPISEGLERLRSADKYVFHNGLGFDLWAINHFHPGTIQQDKLIDTLVLARLANPEERNHSLKAWGERTGTMKGEYAGDFSQFDEELITYARQDIPAGRALFHQVKHVLEWGNAAELEHKFAALMIAQEKFGFPFNVRKAEELDLAIRAELDAMAAELQETFPPLERRAIFTPKVNSPKYGYIKGQEFVKTWKEPFNPGSRAHIAERLQLLGWKPKAFGANGVAAVDEKVLATIPHPKAAVLMRYFTLSKRLGMLAEGKEAWLKNVRPDGRMHGRVNPNGAVTGRCSHSKPNVAQADKKDKRMRELFEAPPGMVLVGCDAEGLEARVLAHYLAKWDQGNYARILLEGDKSIKTDVHSLNLKALLRAGLIRGEKPDIEAKWGKLRDGSKTLLYALLYGAKDRKLGNTLREIYQDCKVSGPSIPPTELGALARKAIDKAIIGLSTLNEAVQAAAKSRGYLLGLDGRHMPVRSPHAALNTLCQGAGAVIMKQALVTLVEDLTAKGRQHGVHYGLCCNVHDEFQISALPEIAEELAGMARASIVKSGEFFKLRCPLAGASEIGKNWSETH
jgi:DNA polymerase-1